MANNMVHDIFCKIVRGEVKSKPIFQNRNFIVIKDINPQAPVHLLTIAKKHFEDISSFKKAHTGLLGGGLMIAEKISKKVGLKNGYRLIINRCADAQGGVPHFHIHILGGKRLGTKIVK